jgi:hypothetical protein
LAAHAAGSCGFFFEAAGRRPAGEADVTEPDGLNAKGPQAMLPFLRGSYVASERKFRLFGVACCRRAWDALLDQRGRHAVEVAARCADGLATPSAREAAEKAAWQARSAPNHCNAADAAHDACLVLAEAGRVAEDTAHEAAWAAASEEEQLSGRYDHGQAGEAPVGRDDAITSRGQADQSYGPDGQDRPPVGGERAGQPRGRGGT